MRKFPTLKKYATPGERMVQPGEARDEEAEGSRRNPSDNDPQVTKLTMKFSGNKWL